jgi:alkylation response protein AidB-like acyl-CoA dehydrogenase
LDFLVNLALTRIFRGARYGVADPIAFARSDEQTMLGDTLREFLEATTTLDAVREASLTETAIDRDVWGGLCEMGLVGLHVPEVYGGAGYSFAETAIVFEELGRRVVPVPLLSTVLAMEAILVSGSDAQKAALLPPIVSGARIASLAVFEDAHDVDSIETRAEPVEDGWALTGTKRYVIDAPNAAQFIVSARTPNGVGLFVVDAGAEGLSVRPTPALDATRPLGEVSLRAVTVEPDAYLGGAPCGNAVTSALDIGVIAVAQEQVGGAQRCLEMSVEYANDRYQFGRAIGSFQAVKHMCADMLVSVEHAKSVAWHAARSISDSEEARIAVPLAMSVCSDAYTKAAGDTIQIFGGIGFTWEHDAHLYFKRAKSLSLLLGSVDYYRDRLADAIGLATHD